MNKKDKPFITVDEQIDKLENRGLHIADRKSAYDKLLHNNYYTVVNGYKLPFLVRQNTE